MKRFAHFLPILGPFALIQIADLIVFYFRDHLWELDAFLCGCMMMMMGVYSSFYPPSELQKPEGLTLEKSPRPS